MELEELMAYKKAYELSNKIWEIVIMLDNFEKNTIGRQLSRAADSISANIAEGYGRFSYKENKQFCFYARGSLYETKDWLNKLENRKIITNENFNNLMNDINDIGKLLNGYIKSIGKTNDK